MTDGRVDDDDRGPYVAIGDNTESRYEAERRPEDPVGGALCAEEVRRLGLWFDGDGDAAELDAARELLGRRFGDACVRPARMSGGRGRQARRGRPLARMSGGRARSSGPGSAPALGVG
ncbi:hypothetical protein ACFWPQ_13530 [Streptomyces sp. NPDC058464]|uniref:hypothetical protein n=1 Tax=Streptomyces sp. NPDC058464 TaxID=3346511 RepID=UPI003653738B